MGTKYLVIVGSLCLLAQNVVAQEFPAEELRGGLAADERITKTPERATPALIGSASVAMGYIRGVSDALSISKACIPQNASPGQKMAIVHKYLNNHPEMWNRPAFDVVAFALTEAFPCKK